jgi:peptide chain release factor 1
LKPSIQFKLENLQERYQEINALLAEPSGAADQKQFRKLSQEHARISPVVAAFAQHQEVSDAIASAEEMLQESDPEMRALAKEDLEESQARQQELEQELQTLLIPSDPHDDSNAFVEVRAGTGGNEAALFVGDLVRMYTRYAENRRWQVEFMNTSEGEAGGFKEAILHVIGRGAYARFKFESGAHRVQRVPETESQGRIHTSACTVAVLPELDAGEEITINPADLRVDTFRASGAGGQHINKPDSAIRLTHLPTGLVVECQDQRSQHKNRARAMAVLQARLNSMEKERQQADEAATRRQLVGSGDRSEKIRTYNFPQSRVTDHRINLTLYKLDDILSGNLDAIVDPLTQEHLTDKLAEVAS